MGDETNWISAINLVSSITKNVFFDCFIAELGMTKSFSKLRCGGEKRMTPEDWETVRNGYRKLSLPCEDMERMTEIAYALTRRAVKEY